MEPATRQLRLFAFPIAFLSVLPSIVYAQGAGTEWETLNKEVMDLYRAGDYGRAVVIAQKALRIAEQNVGPDHPDVATTLENLARLYRATNRNAEAKALERRAARIRAIKR
ncbi:MAG: tetratricopeptide repeat protein [Candidatus Kryptoniota bacterium]